MKRFQIPIRSSTQDSTTGLPSTPDPTVPATSIGISKIRSRLSPNYECLQSDDRSAGGLCATLAQRDDQNRTKIISLTSRQLKENEKNYTLFLLEVAAAAWGMDNFNEYLKGIYPIYGSYNGTKSGQHTNENIEQIEDFNE
jgi:hypothetical protein